MRKGLKKILSAATAAIMAFGALSLTACGYKLPPLKDNPGADDVTVSNGGFVVDKGDYYYFINGRESYSSNNTYGTPVRGSLMRIKKSALSAADKAERNQAEMVIPSLMAAGDYGAGIYIFGDRIYYATPNTVRDTSSNSVDATYLDFKSAKLDGTGIKSYFRVSDNSTTYRIVEAGEGADKAVYILYVESSNLYSFNTSTNTLTALAEGVSDHSLGKASASPEWIYYTMKVVQNADSDKSNITADYNQIYRVRADATDVPDGYDYDFDEDYIKSELDGKSPYVNLGEIVLDGRGTLDEKTKFNHSDAVPNTPLGYKYAVRTGENGGLYFTREELADNGSVGQGAELYYVSEDDLAGSWDSVSGNGSLDLIASSNEVSEKATTSALYYIENGEHHYLYVSNGSIYRSDVSASGEDLEIAHSLTGPTLRYIDDKDATYKYVYYTDSNGSGISVSRAVYNGDPSKYEDLQFGSENTKPYKAVNVLDVQHTGSWYPFEIIDNILFYADASSTVNSTSYNYIHTVSLSEGGALMNNEQIAELNEKYDALMDADDGLFAKISSDISSKLATALRYYFYTGETEAFEANILEAQEVYNKSDVYLYSKEEQEAFYAFAKGESYSKGDEVYFTEGAEGDYLKEYRTLSDFVTFIGRMEDNHAEARADYWYDYLERYPIPTASEGGLAAWAWALIGIAIALVVLGAAAAVVVFVVILPKKRAEAGAPKAEKLHVDTTDDRSVNVYEDEPKEQAPVEQAPVEEKPVEEASVEEESAEEAPAEESPAEEPVEDAPAEEKPAEEAPAQDAAAEAPKPDSEE